MDEKPPTRGFAHRVGTVIGYVLVALLALAAFAAVSAVGVFLFKLAWSMVGS